MTLYEGNFLALGAAFCWTASTLFFSEAGRRIGSLPVNVIRLALALVFLSVYGRVARGLWLPTDFSRENWFWLSLSGFVGFFLGDLFLFRAMVLIGPRLSSLLMALAPPIAALTSWLWMNETLGLREILGMMITIVGVGWVVLERPVNSDGQAIRVSPVGVLLAILGAAGQGVGLVMSKQGMLNSSPGLSTAMASTQIRAITGLSAFLLLSLFMRRLRKLVLATRNLPALGLTTGGAIAGPFLGVAFLMRAIQIIPAGVAQTITATVPVLILPVLILFYKERISWRAALGAVIAVGGISLLFLHPLPPTPPSE
ncbi:MAG TPA: DMT family transporter [Candidatus Sumerlaeota bacterium]|nr:DMT family transporter [Candidatus Sumerlaeota bacterium]HPS00419.1 DMT family transporter [Candidatus Sumerlaeota bacterium]